MTTATRCGVCKHVDGDEACAHEFQWSEEIKTTSPAYRRRWCVKCKLSECIQVCGPENNRPHPCGQADCRYCGWTEPRPEPRPPGWYLDNGILKWFEEPSDAQKGSSND